VIGQFDVAELRLFAFGFEFGVQRGVQSGAEENNGEEGEGAFHKGTA
jgi:hypothetical protein